MPILRRPLLAAAALALLPAAALPQHYHCGPPPPLTQPVVPLWPGVDSTVSFPISSGNDSTKAYFDQGLALIYGFNHLESVLSFRKAAQFDPKCAICWWGIAIALGPNINEPINQQRWEMALAALDTAGMPERSASEEERRYIAAARLRYFNPDGSRPRFPIPDTATFNRTRREMDRRYADAMGSVWSAGGRQNPHLGTMYAEALMDLHPWDLWNRDGTAKWPETRQVSAVVNSILAKEPEHVGAAHLKIHVHEGSAHPDSARREADILEGLMPGSAHITHMPSHIDHRMGAYAAGVGHNRRATALDSAYLDFRGWMWRYPMYFAHDNDFLWVSATFAGLRADALASADSLNGIVEPELIRCYPSAEHFLTAPILVRVRFGMWSEALRQAPPRGYDYAMGMWHYARGWALLRMDSTRQAEVARDSARAYAARLEGRSIANNPADTLVLIAVHTLTGEIEAARGNQTAAIGELRQAVRMQDSLDYDEPPPFFYPARHSLGAVLVETLDSTNAERALEVYRTDLGGVGRKYAVNHNPRNAWAYVGMARAMQVLRRDPKPWLDSAAAVWKGGELPPASRYPQQRWHAYTAPLTISANSARLVSTTLRAAPGTVTLDGVAYPVNLYAGSLLPPVLKLEPGDSLRVLLVNDMDTTAGDTTNLHFHGFAVSPRPPADNVVRTHVPRGGRYQYAMRLPRDHAQGLFWYHPHPHGSSYDQVKRGMSGAISIGDPRRYFPEYAGIPEVYLLLKFFQPDAPSAEISTVNGVPRVELPEMRVGDAQFWRIGNITTERYYRLRLVGPAGDSVAFQVLARDGNVVAQGPPVMVDEVLLGAGQRAEVVVRGARPGYYTLVATDFVRQDSLPDPRNPRLVDGAAVLARVKVNPTPGRPNAVAAAPRPGGHPGEARLIRALVAAPADAVFRDSIEFEIDRNTRPTRYMIDHALYDPDNIAKRLVLGRTYAWRIKNASQSWHTFHIHQGDFVVDSVGGRKMPPDYRLDTVSVPPCTAWLPDKTCRPGAEGVSVIRFRYDSPAVLGEFVYHCHMLFHEDNGMMANVQLVPRPGDAPPPGGAPAHRH
ncbi:MAG TPA: multicopper oxidase family protein [Longimicrobium sp.]|jgi:FtsP/CotA-like multicopper oxidase with cupredoxin domain